MAEADLKSAKILLETNNFNNSAYHSQQATEKAIKALLILKNEFVESHFVADKAKKILEKKSL
ncbi:MAG: HEPN domain-containing protein [Candidatus Aenigmatarchaeota archaeon]